jgi:hypothetical protein
VITVAIMINGKVIYSRSARNITEEATSEKNSGVYGKGTQTYKLDTGEVINSKFEDGAVKLAIKMLKTIQEV